MTKMQVWLVMGSFQAAAPDTTGAFERGSMDSSQAQTSACSVVCLRIAKLLPRQHASKLESVSSADLVLGQGWVAAVDELEFVNWVDE